VSAEETESDAPNESPLRPFGLPRGIRAYRTHGKLCLLTAQNTALGTLPACVAVDVGADIGEGPLDVVEPHLAPSFFAGLRGLKSQLNAEETTQKARDLVKRARVGDQNAMGLLAAVGENAKKGVPRARVAMGLFQRVLKENPIDVGAESVESTDPAITTFISRAGQAKDGWTYPIVLAAFLPTDALVLAQGPNLTRQLIDTLLSLLPPDWAELVQRGLCQPNGIPSPVDPRVRCGQAIDWARRLQMARVPTSSLKGFSNVVAWELGE